MKKLKILCAILALTISLPAVVSATDIEAMQSEAAERAQNATGIISGEIYD